MVKSKSLNLFLLDGEPTGRIKCSLLNWTGLGYKIPNACIKDCNDIAALKNSGVYFLFGTDNDGNNVVYVGQARTRKNEEGILNRIKEPHDSVDYWNTAVIFTTHTNSLGPTEICYLENKFCNLAKNAKRYIVKNGNDPSQGNITEEKQSEMDEFVEFAMLVMGVLGYQVFEPYISATDEYKSENVLTYSFKGLVAKGLITNEGFVVLKGSQLSNEFTKRFKDSLPLLREKYKNEIKDNVLIENILFSSPSGAASFCSGQSISGNVCWIDKDGKSFKDKGNK